jgi:outer membrane biosynthesis protein TonB
MNASATDVIVARSREVDRLSTMMLWSLGVHVVVMAFLVVVPHPQADLTQEEPMMISLGGAPGPRTGMTQMAARNVQAPRPETVKNDTAPAPVQKEMTLPDPRSKPQARPKDAPKEATAKTVSTGEEVQQGQARAETRVRGQGFAGLSSGGGAAGGGVTVDAPNFCCQEYINTMIERIRRNWKQDQDFAGVTRMVFTIHRDGRIEGIKRDRSSGFEVLDLESARALRLAQLPRLPDRYTNPTLTVYLEFEYVKP